MNLSPSNYLCGLPPELLRTIGNRGTLNKAVRITNRGYLRKGTYYN